MAIPWSGFPFAALIKFARPLSAAKYVRMETFFDAKVASGQRQTWYPWPYVEGLTIETAAVTDFAAHESWRQKVHLQLDGSGAFAFRAAALDAIE